MMDALSDSFARTRGATAGDRNIVITAGAGTGKTTLLVDRLVHLLLNRPEPLAVAEVVALTFTNKAADEMKLRLRTRLVDLLNNELAAKALRELEQSQIGTIHSFAAHLLRLYPLESGVDPAFTQDDGSRFDEFFKREWSLWLDQELGAAGTQQEAWTVVLQTVTLEEVREFARNLAGELIPLDDRHLDIGHDDDRPPIRQWLKTLAQKAGTLRAAHQQSNKLERMLDHAVLYLERVEQGDCLAEERGPLSGEVPGITKDWSREDHREAKRIIRVAQAIALVRIEPLQLLLRLIVPFVRDCRRRFVHTGLISFDGLVARARDLLRDYPVIRQVLKAQFRSILVDEFQDTDPVQYEMILYLAESTGREAADWRQVQLEPGKLFIVGDPKQSIYAFRRADMEAYDAVIEDHILLQTPCGERHALHTNFRSHARLLTTINSCFAHIFPQQTMKGLQPQHDPLLASHTETTALPNEGVEMRLVRSEAADPDADTVGRAEAEELARWLREEVLGREEICEQGGPVTVKPGHVAILFRTLTDMRDYVEALRRYDIPCLTEGEKHFYERQEVIDAINLLRAAVNPHDRLALAAVLRSSLGGVPDAQIEALVRHNVLDYRIAATDLEDRPAQAAYDSAAPVYALLRDLSHALPRLPLTDVLDTLLAQAPLLELAAASLDGEQAVANLLKLRDLGVQLAERPDLTLTGLIDELMRRALDLPEETESSLAEDFDDKEETGFVRLLSIHKAKGLEFPVVVLAGLQRGTNRVPSSILVQHDWSTEIVGIRLGDLETLGGVYVSAKLAERQRAEASRVLYVAMTRAKRRLVLSAGIPQQLAPDSFLTMVLEGLGMTPEMLEREVGATTVPIEDGEVSVHVVSGKAVPLQTSGRQEAAWHDAADDITSFRTRWTDRLHRREEALHQPLFLSPSLLKAKMDEPTARERRQSSQSASEISQLVGILAHRMLEAWDFQRSPQELIEGIEATCRTNIPIKLADQSIVIRRQLKKLFNIFLASESYTILTRATVIGREIPFTIPWMNGQVMEGVIDLIYRLDGAFWIADYKTDQVTAKDVEERAMTYREQARIYRAAVSRCLGIEDVGFQFIFLRIGKAITM
ncbi:MAG: UvrD-helicase domain-containing protein [Nitrospiraceae bacterium]